MTRAEFLIVLAHAAFSIIGLTIIALQLAVVSRQAAYIAELIVKTH
jgi:hypothetical protein